MTTISKYDDVIDSREIIERIGYLTNQCEDDFLDYDEYNELVTLSDLAEECSDLSSDWEYGEPLIHRDYFETYMDEMVEGCYEIPKNMPFWMSIKLDYAALGQDYSSVFFGGQEYLIRNI